MHDKTSFFNKSVDVNLAVGSIASTADVAGGAAAYYVPIAVPLGTNGLTPELAITYSSTSGNGVLGQVWAISGLSVIARTGQNIYFDGKVSPTSLSIEDRFILDGQRLLTTSGAYGTATAIYKTESENFNQVVPLGTLGSGPLSFKMTTKDGAVIEYGGTTDARFLTEDGKHVLYWRISKITYLDGNYMQFKYVNVDRDSRIDEINYTGNVAAGLLPYNKIKFSYWTRTDINTTYDAGSSVVSKYLLDKITITSTNNNVSQTFKSYTFKYGLNEISSFLNEIIESGSNGSALNSTIFKYGDRTVEIFNEYYTSGVDKLGSDAIDKFIGDYNGDGKTDVLVAHRKYNKNGYYHYKFEIYTRTGNGVLTLLSTTDLPYKSSIVANRKNVPNNYQYYSSDFSGDGVDDVLIGNIGYSTQGKPLLNSLELYTSNKGISFTVSSRIPQPNYNVISTNGNFLLPGDFDGDGVNETIVLTGNSTGKFDVFYCPNTNTGACGTLRVNGKILASEWALGDTYILDFDGDGKQDVMVNYKGFTEIFTIDFANGLANSIYLTTYNFGDGFVFGDFNGDRKTDILSQYNPTDWNISYSTGKNWNIDRFTFNRAPKFSKTGLDDDIIVADYNGDGKMDILHAYNNYVNGVASTSSYDVYYTSGDKKFSYKHNDYASILDPVSVLAADMNGDGRSDLLTRPVEWIYVTKGGYYILSFRSLYFRPSSKENLLRLAKNGVGHIVEWDYDLMSEPSFYDRGDIIGNPVNRVKVPINNVQLPMYLVSEFHSLDGIGGANSVGYSYGIAKLHKEGKGLMGFGKITTRNLATGFTDVVENDFNYTYYILNPSKASTYLNANGSLVKQTTFTNEFKDLGNKRFWQRSKKTLEDKVLEKAKLTTEYTTYDDTNGNLTELNAEIKGYNNVVLETSKTETIYAAFGSTLKNKPISVTSSQTRSGQTPAYSFTTKYNYNALGQMILKVDYDGWAKSVTTTYDYNNLGNQTGVTVTATGIDTRVSRNVYDTRGRYPIEFYNTLNQKTTTTYHPIWGKPTFIKSIDDLTVGYDYDNFGRLAKTATSDGYDILESYVWDINAATGTLSYQQTTHPSRPDNKIWVDILGRPVRKETEGFGTGIWIIEKTSYDAKGNVSTITTPYKTGETPLITTTTYDLYNRPAKQVNSIGTTIYAYSYDNGTLVTTITNPALQVSSKKTDITGKLIETTDYGGTLSYSYFNNGKVKEVKNGTVVINTNEYDIYSNQTKLIDANAGTTQYEYDAFGQLTKQINAKNEVLTFEFDKLGRKTKRTEPSLTTTIYEYFTTGTGAVNKLKKITNFAGNLEEYNYYTDGRVWTKTETIDNTAYITTYSYDAYGNLVFIAYPNFSLAYAYDDNGYVETISDAFGPTLFTNNGMNSFDQYTNYTLGNGKSSTINYYYGIPIKYETAAVQNLTLAWNYVSGNLTNRTDAVKNKTESFTYDNLNRLLTWQVGTGTTFSNTYANNGNINTKSDAGGYVYKTNEINAVERITNALNIPTNTQNISYTPFFQPATVAEGAFSLSYTYGADYERIKGVLKQTNNNITLTTNTRYYFGDYEKNTDPISSRFIYYVSNGQSLVAIVVYENNQYKYYYTYTDHLGSILAATDNTGAIVAEQNFDPWGRKRNVTNWDYTSVGSTPNWLYRGYTGHEHMTQFGLINMNGRLYDPVVGRMLSVDNYVQSPDFTQSYNRYGYAFNNPLKYNDPDGNVITLPAAAIGAIFGAVINVGYGLLSGEIQGENLLRDVVSYAVSGAAIGALAGLTGGASLAVTGTTAATMAGGIVSGVTGGAVGGFLQSGFNTAYQAVFYQDKNHYQPKDILRNAVSGGVGGAIVGGVVGGVVGGYFQWKNGKVPVATPGNAPTPLGAGSRSGGFSEWTQTATGTGKINYYTNSFGGDIDEVVIGVTKKIYTPSGNFIAHGYAVARDFFAGARYSPKVLRQMRMPDNHGFPESVRAFQKNGIYQYLKGGDGNYYHHLKIPGTYNGYEGFFHFIQDATGEINHRIFQILNY